MNNKKLIAFNMYDTWVHMKKHPNPYKIFFSQLGLQDSVSKELSFLLQTTDQNIKNILAKNIQFQKNIDFLLSELQSNIDTQIYSLSLYDDFLPAINILKQRGYKTAVVSNLTKPYMYPITHLVPENTFDYQIFSFKVGEIKPHKKIFDYLKTISGYKSDDIVMVGDSLISDIQGAKNAGIDAIHIQREQSPIRKAVDYIQISSLSDLVSIFTDTK